MKKGKYILPSVECIEMDAHHVLAGSATHGSGIPTLDGEAVFSDEAVTMSRNAPQQDDLENLINDILTFE
jgi:hypothetical protein